ncbi:MAG TPA: STAS domain-containing protein [Solirubrobacterales bacterium]|nr:STAS domain-containing protein [Solirubrobacterales bacterium]
MQIFRLTEVPSVDGERELRVEGELDLAVADRLQDALDGIDAKRVLIDLGDCDFIDSTGIAVIVRADQRARESGGRVAIHSPSAPVLRVLSLSGLTENGLVFENRDRALSGTV